MGAILNVLVSLVLYAVVIYIVSRLNLGLSVDGFVGAFIAGAAIAIIAWLVNWLLGSVLKISIGASWFGAIVSLVVSAIVLLLAARFVPGLKVEGFVGALVAAIAIAVIAWLIGLFLPVNANPTTALLLSLF